MITEHDVLMWIVPVFASILSFTGFGIVKELRKLTGLTQNLAIKIAVIVEKIDHHEIRIRHLEKK